MPHDRRTFLRRSLAGMGTLLLPGAGAALLDACGAGDAGDRGTSAAVQGVRHRVQEAVREVIEGTTIRDLVVEKQRLDEAQSLMAGI